MYKGIYLLPVLLLYAVSVPADDDALARIDALARGGATQLALRLLDAQQPPDTDIEAWTAWERERLSVYRLQDDWQAIIDAADHAPQTLPVSARRWLQEEAADASLGSGDAPRAREYLRRLLATESVDKALTSRWRRMVIRSYLIENRIDDAQTALLRYKQDYAAKSEEWQLLHARVLLRADKPKAAFDVLAGNQSHEAHALRLLAALRGKLRPPAKVLAEGLKLSPAVANHPQLQWQVWALVAEAAAAAGDTDRRVLALERVFSLPARRGSGGRLFGIQADDLWDAYNRQAKAVANREKLLVGDTPAWMKRAAAYSRDDAYRARALYAFVARNAGDTEAGHDAHIKLIESLLTDGRDDTVRALYFDSPAFSPVDTLPDILRDRLADVALRAYDIELASRLIRGVELAPEGADPDQWAMRQARILVYAGDYGLAIQRLNDLLAHSPVLDDGLVGPFLQIVFDLQAVNRHQPALDLLQQLFLRCENETTRRELLFWMADSEKGLEHYTEAAELYLRSAVYLHPAGGDFWGQTARFHAAEALAKAGLLADARQVYARLLQHTEDPKQRAVIQRNAQQLWLQEAIPTTR